MHDLRHSPGAFPNVSARWLLGAAGVALLAAVACAWLVLCLLYWQGSWQLLYHPRAAITRTPANAGITFEPIRFAATETGTTQLTGWWLPSPDSRFTVLYLHGADGNLSDSIEALAALHQQNLATFAIDYRGYGQSQAARPNEKQFRQDAEWALTWLTVTRNIPAKSIVVFGSGLGANLAAELAADHSELAGVILDQPSADATEPIFHDPRSRLVPAHLLVSDRYNLFDPVARLQIRSLWILPQTKAQGSHSKNGADSYEVADAQTAWNAPATDAYTKVPGHKMAEWLTQPTVADPHFPEALKRWLDDLQDPLRPVPETNQLTR
jgi:uncharacterized protein